jgi:membrane protein implicated in regulation of membrane protease activity
MESWIWLVIGIGLVIMELVTPCGFYLFILGISAFGVGLLVYLGIVLSWSAQAILFCAFAVACWLIFGQRIRAARKQVVAKHGQLEGNIVRIAADIAPGASGSGELWGTQWRIENIGNELLESGAEAVVIASEGVTLKVKRK